MRGIVFGGGVAVGLLIGLTAPVWATNEASQVQALDARVRALEARVSGDSQGGTVVASPKKLELTAGDEIRLTTGRASLVLKKDGTIDLVGREVLVKETSDTKLKGSKINQN